MTQAAVLAASGSPGTTTGFKNKLINGNMIISQRNGTTATSQTNGSYSLDRWYSLSYDGSVATGKYTVTQSSTAPTGFINSLLVTSSAATSSGASDIYTIGQAVEGYNIADLSWGTANAKTVTVSFWVRSSVTGTFGAFIRNAALDYSYPTTYTISAANTWEQKSITIPGPTSGTWPTDNTAGLYVWFQLQVGSSFVVTPNAWTATPAYGASGCVNFLNTNGATFYVTGCQLEVGTTATNFDFRSYGTELALCQRYYWKISGGQDTGGSNVYAAVGTGYSSSASTATVVIPMQTQMRTSPTISYGGSIYAQDGGGSTVTSISSNYGGRQSVFVAFNTSGSNTSGRGLSCYTGSSFPTDFVSGSSEL